MANEQILYRIKPVDKKSIEIVYEAYKERPDGSTVGWSVKELYRWGQGFVESEDELPYLEDKWIRTDPTVGDGAELDDGQCGFCFPYGYCSTCGDPLEWYDGQIACLHLCARPPVAYLGCFSLTIRPSTFDLSEDSCVENLLPVIGR